MASTDDEKEAALYFAEMFCNMLDKHRDQLAAYLAHDAVLDWFGRTIRSKNAIAWFMKFEVPETIHSLTSVEPSGPIRHLKKVVVEPVDSESNVTLLKGQILLHDSHTDEGLAKPLDGADCMVEQVDVIAKLNLSSLSLHENGIEKCKSLKPFQPRYLTAMKCGIPILSEQYYDVRCKVQGDCHHKPSVKSFTKPSRFLEARGSIHFQRTKQPDLAANNMKLMSDTMKWCRFCKVQIAYSTQDTFHTNDCGDGIVGDFKIWLLVYKDNTRCRRNLSEAFNKVK
jgi:hypothetical protein